SSGGARLRMATKPVSSCEIFSKVVIRSPGAPVGSLDASDGVPGDGVPGDGGAADVDGSVEDDGLVPGEDDGFVDGEVDEASDGLSDGVADRASDGLDDELVAESRLVGLAAVASERLPLLPAVPLVSEALILGLRGGA